MQSESVRSRLVRSFSWTLSQSVCFRLLAFVNVVVVARILTPDDFGVFAAAFMAANMAKILTDVSVDRLLVRERDIGREYYDTAWTVKLIQGSITCVFLILVAPVAANYFGDFRIQLVVQVFGVFGVVAGLTNIGVVQFYKNLRWKRHFKLNVSAKVISVTSTIPVALWLGNYWALVIGGCVGTVFTVFISYRMSDYRPRLSLNQWRQFIGFAVHMQALSVFRFIGQRFDAFVVGGFADIASFGFYNTAAYYSNMAMNELVGPITNALFPNFAALSSDRPKLMRVYVLSIGAVASFAFPFGFGLAAVGDDFIAVLLGSQWGATGSLIKTLGMAAAFNGVCLVVSSQILIVCRAERTLVLLTFMRATAVVGAVLYSSQQSNMYAIPAALLAVSLVTLPVYVAIVSSTLKISPFDITRVLWRPLIAAAAMYFAVTVTVDPNALNSFGRLVLGVLLGALVYFSSVLGLWFLAKRPPGIETELFKLVRSRFSSQ